MRARITVLGGDGIGPEVVREAVRVLRAVADRFGHTLDLDEHLVGGRAIDSAGEPLPQATLKACRESDAVLLGAVGGPKWESAPQGKRPEDGLLALRKKLGLFANLRPIKPLPRAASVSPIRQELLRDVDLLVVRELTGGIYFGAKHRSETDAYDLCSYTRQEIERIVRLAGSMAASRRRKLCSVDKANVLETSRLWRAVTTRVIEGEFANVELRHQLVDSAAMQLISRPDQFDVIVTENMFGDILTDEASVLAGSIGMLPSASLGELKFGLYEPIHGSAPDIAGKGIANPCGAILSAAMLLRMSLGLEDEAALVEAAVADAVESGVLPRDICPQGTTDAASTEQAGAAVVERLGKSRVQVSVMKRTTARPISANTAPLR